MYYSFTFSVNYPSPYSLLFIIPSTPTPFSFPLSSIIPFPPSYHLNSTLLPRNLAPWPFISILSSIGTPTKTDISKEPMLISTSERQYTKFVFLILCYLTKNECFTTSIHFTVIFIISYFFCIHFI